MNKNLRFYVVEAKKLNQYNNGMIKAVRLDPGREFEQISNIEKSKGFIRWIIKGDKKK